MVVTQVVTYSSKIVDTLSEVVGSMNVSYSGSTKKGTIEIARSTSSINEEKIERSAVNAVVSVKVRMIFAAQREDYLRKEHRSSIKLPLSAQTVNSNLWTISQSDRMSLM